MNNEPLSIGEKWAADLRAYERGARVRTSIPQCQRCMYFVKGDALHCQKYSAESKPRNVMFALKECPEFSSNDPLNIQTASEKEERLFGAVFGFCVGDALGVPVEFSSRQERDADPVAEMRAYGTYHQPFGAWSDDTSLMLCLMDAIVKGFSLEKLCENMDKFYRKGEFTPYGEIFDIGNSTATAIRKMIAGVAPTKCGGTDSMDNGNGSLMRILPLAFVTDTRSPEALIKCVEDVSSVTHAHDRSKLACIIYICFASALIKGASKAEALEAAIQFVNQYCKDRYQSELRNYLMVLSKQVVGMTRERIASTGYVIDTLEAVLWSFFITDSYCDAVLNAINLGGDTDTIAALTGGLAGIYYGFSGIPSNWLQTILKKHEIAKLTEQFLHRVEIR